jgi:hypothetical protein
MTDSRKSGGRGVAILLIACIAIVAFWEIMANRSRRPFEPFDLTSENFNRFFPSSDEWTVRALPVNSSPTEPNILALELSSKARSKVKNQRSEVRSQRSSVGEGGPASPSNAPTISHSDTPLLRYSHTSGHAPVPVTVRLVHGYNMPDCMRIKGYQVELIGDTRGQGAERRTSNPAERGKHRIHPALAGHPTPVVERSSLRGFASNIEGQKTSPSHPVHPVDPVQISPPPTPDTRHPLAAAKSSDEAGTPDTPGLQIWRLTSAVGDTAIWVTAMLRAGDLEKTDADVRSMAFPRIGVPIDPNWVPPGITLKSLRHPKKNFRRLIQAKWNNSRCDPAVFLRLKQPAWASEEMLTLVAASPDIVIKPEDEQLITDHIISAHSFVHTTLKSWNTEKTE